MTSVFHRTSTRQINRLSRRRCVAEQLEQRLFLAGDVMAQHGLDEFAEAMSEASVVPTSTETTVSQRAKQEVVAVSEFVAVNRDGFRDYFAQSSDWIELENQSDHPINLRGWFLTDDADDLFKWRIPQDTVLQGGEQYLVRASGRDVVTPNDELHANFRLSNAGEYLAVVRPGGAISWETPIDVPQQFADVSYGISDLHLTTPWVERGSPVKVYVPQDNSLQDSWYFQSFDDTAWADQTLGVGFAYDNPTQMVPGFQVRMIQSVGGADGMVNNIREADGMLSGGAALARHEIGLDISTNTPVIDFGSGLGTFPTANPLPNGATDASVDEFVLGINANVTIPPGPWMIGFGSEDGGRLRMPGVAFSQAFGQRGFSRPGEGELLYQNPREHDWTWGVFEIGEAGLSTNLELIYFGHEGLESLELAIAPGQSNALPTTDSWKLLEDGTLGWQIQSIVPAPPAEAKTFVVSDIEAELLGHNTTAYVRAAFELSDIDSVDRLQLNVQYDDAFVAYLNGTEIARANFTDQPVWNSAADEEKPDIDLAEVAVFDLTEHLDLIHEGTNTLAVHVLNASLDSPLLLFAPELEAIDEVLGTLNYLSIPTPGEPNGVGFGGLVQAPAFSVNAGTFSSDFRLQLSSDTPNATIRYTTDGSLPDETSPIYTEQILISESTTVRSLATLRNHIRSPVSTAHYIKLVDGAAEFSSNLPLLVIDTFGGSIREDDFATSFSLLFEPGEDGRTRLTGSPAVATRSGVRVRGSSSAWNAKPPLALEFWRDESNTDRDWPLLGMPADADWVLHGPFLFDRTHTKNAFIYELSNQLGHYAPRTRYVELFLNRDDEQLTASDYAGIYVIIEKIKRGAHRVDVPQLPPLVGTEDITGGFIIKRDRFDPGDTGFEIGDVTNLAHVEPKEQEIKQRSDQEAWLHDYLNRFHATLKSPKLTHPTFGSYTDFIDPLEWVDYAMLNEIVWNVDTFILSAFMHIDDEGILHTGPVWDYDRTLDSFDTRDNDPLSWRSYDPGFEDVSSYLRRYYGWWGLLFQDIEFQQLYIDRWQELRGAEFQLEHILGTIDRQANQLREAEPRDTERWPTVRPRIKAEFDSGLLDGTWEGELAHQAEFLRRRLPWLDSKFLGQPVFDRQPGRLLKPTVVTLSGPETAILYYTTNGTDPRLPGGDISPTAIAYDGPIAIDETTTITARSYDREFDSDFVLDPESWSGPTVGQFDFSALPADVLRVSELHYNPGSPSVQEVAAGFDDKDDFEFIELVNIGVAEVNLEEVKLIQTTVEGETEGVAYSFVTGKITRLAPGEHVVVVENITAFLERYGTADFVAGEWTGGLGNAGELITLTSGDELIQQFRYDDGWYSTTDGGGFSLETVDVTAATVRWGQAEGWGASQTPDGTPGRSKVRGDFNSDGRVNAQDIDLLHQAARTQGPATSFDLTNDGRVLRDDVDELVTGVLMTRFGDTDLDGDVDALDFATLANNFGRSGVSWPQGDFDGDGNLTFADFVILANNFDFSRRLP